MRILVTLLFAALLFLGVWTFADAETFLLAPMPEGYTWWWPKEISTYGQDIDFLFELISWMVLVFFVLTEGMLVWFVYKYSKPTDEKGSGSHGNHKLELLWTAIPAGLLLIIAFAQMSTFANIKFAGSFENEPVFGEIWGSQFDWRFKYPGHDGRLGTADDVESPFELVVPDDQKIVMNLRSRDVLHSFFIPKLRLKQDAVPGMTIPIWFQVDQEQLAEESKNEFDIICAELCGWGHYKMSGRIRIVSRAEFDAWIDEMTTKKFDNGEIN